MKIWQWILIILLILGIVGGIIAILVNFYQSTFQHAKGQPESKIIPSKIFYVKAVDEKGNQMDIDILIKDNETKTAHLSALRWEELLIRQDSQLIPFSNTTYLSYHTCDFAQERCILNVTKKGTYIYNEPIFETVSNNEIKMEYRINCINGLCNYTAICLDWGKVILTEPLQIKQATINAPAIDVPNRKHCYEIAFSNEYLDYDVSIKHYGITDNDYVTMYIADKHYVVENGVITEGYIIGGEDVGYNNTMIKIYPTKKESII